MLLTHAEQEYVYVISDLHLGGRGAGWIPEKRPGEPHPDRRMCSERGQELLVEFLTALKTKARRLEAATLRLVINGDFVDFLAEANSDGKFSAFSGRSEDAARKLKRIMNTPRAGDPAKPGEAGCSEVFDALRDLLKEPRARIVLLLGNHDIELSWKDCKELLQNRLLEDDRPPDENQADNRKLIIDTKEIPQNRLHEDEGQPDKNQADNRKLIIDTSGEQCVIGKLWIEHGNRYDIWNYVNYEQLSNLTAGTPKARFKQPLGSDLVVDVINPLKAKYGFVDLLKPETRGVVPLLWYLLPPGGERTRLTEKIPIGWLILKKFAQKLGLHTPNWKAGGSQEKNKATTNSEGLPESALADAEILFEKIEFEDLPLLRVLLSDELHSPSYRPRARSEQHAQAAETAFEDDVIAFFYWISPNGYSLSNYENDGSSVSKKIVAEIHNIITRLQTDAIDQLTTNLEKNEYIRAFKDIIQHRNTENSDGKLERATDTVIFGHTHVMKHISETVVNGDKPCHYINTGTWADLMLFPPQELAATENFINDIRNNHLSNHKHNLPSFAFVKLQSGEVVERSLRVFRGTVDDSLEIKAHAGKTLSQLASEYAKPASEPASS